MTDTQRTDPERERVVVALGGNALLDGQDSSTVDGQVATIERTARRVAALVEDGHEVVLTHGNGPQVGNRLLQQACTDETPQHPLDVLVAETQAQVGYLLQQALGNELPEAAAYLTVVTRTLVDPADPAFEEPTKPVGPHYTEAEAAEKSFETKQVGSGARPYRRVVPSPEPVAVVESDRIARLLERDSSVVCAGGGGVPVVRDGGLRGVEAVVDKDRTSQLLASDLGADTLVILTDVEHACVNYGETDQRPLRTPSPETLRANLAAGEFGEGSMRPKVEACLRFVEGGGGRAIITSPEWMQAALAGDTGTQIVT